jgi:hypothetical protein
MEEDWLKYLSAEKRAVPLRTALFGTIVTESESW